MAHDRTRGSHIHQKIHALRGEYFRHIQNRAHAEASSARDTREALFVLKRVERPQHDIATTPTWRAAALALTVPAVAESHKVPPLTLLCLQILSSFETDFPEIVQYVPSHLRLALLRWAAVHRPLTTPQLQALCAHGHVAGELIVVGPSAGVNQDQFRGPEEGRSVEWESDDWTPPPPMHTLVLMSAHLTLSIICTLPATLTHLALVNILNPVSLHRLPMTCPLVECLDLSYNAWLVAEKEAQERLGKLQWSRWHQLRTLGLRGCHVPADLTVELNKGRWDDVQVVK
ncbi:hypothetical protein B0H14DRAFT_2660914 [Mycena olivaceomarginata]|nr:hypothetical protein B0H14DRAFT_2660914 [Mycena olivaceomarginata]